MQKLKVIYEDNHIIVVEKIPNIPSQADKTGDTDMLSLVKSYIKENPEVIQKFTNAINKGLDYVWNNDEEIVAKAIVEYFPDMTINELSKMIKRYKDNDAWMKDTYFTEESFDHLQDIMISAGELDKKVPYKDLVDTTFSKK